MSATRPPIRISYEVAFRREVQTVADHYVIEALTAFCVGSMSHTELRAHASTLYDKRLANFRALRSMTAIHRAEGLNEEARAAAGYRLHKILDRVQPEGV